MPRQCLDRILAISLTLISLLHLYVGLKTHKVPSSDVTRRKRASDVGVWTVHKTYVVLVRMVVGLVGFNNG